MPPGHRAPRKARYILTLPPRSSPRPEFGAPRQSCRRRLRIAIAWKATSISKRVANGSVKISNSHIKERRRWISRLSKFLASVGIGPLRTSGCAEISAVRERLAQRPGSGFREAASNGASPSFAAIAFEGEEGAGRQKHNRH